MGACHRSLHHAGFFIRDLDAALSKHRRRLTTLAQPRSILHEAVVEQYIGLSAFACRSPHGKMIRLFLLAAAAGFLAGCGTEVQPPNVTGVDATQTIVPDDAHCIAVARERANDALANGYGFQIEESVFQESYADCVAWRAGKPK